MGAGKRDMHKKSRDYDERYPYKEDGVKALLRDIFRLTESQYLNGDIDATVIITDLKMALDSDCLTPRMRQVVALYYFVGFTLEETGNVLGLGDKSNVSKYVTFSMERISAEMEYGYKQSNGARTDAILTPTNEVETDLFELLNDIARGERSIYTMDDDICTAAVRYSARNGDKKAQEVVRQRKEGYVLVDEDFCYPALTWEQMRWDDRRISYVPEVYPSDDKVGRRKVAIKLREGDKYGREWRLEKRAMFSNRN